MARKRKEIDFEASMEELEALVAKMEAGDLKMEEALSLYAQGISLSQTCLEKLNAVEEQMVKIVKEHDGLLKEIQLPLTDKE
ncbi:exodeoxyribonuclease VII small subunit [Azotosporobacter soli]|uniref:exodeoxyribonuclease VII small subunit n=1 Tax=Azotosporobacter soli TaxID=3055040 RepID=UPI0031FEC923